MADKQDKDKSALYPGPVIQPAPVPKTIPTPQSAPAPALKAEKPGSRPIQEVEADLAKARLDLIDIGDKLEGKSPDSDLRRQAFDDARAKYEAANPGSEFKPEPLFPDDKDKDAKDKDVKDGTREEDGKETETKVAGLSTRFHAQHYVVDRLEKELKTTIQAAEPVA